MCEIIQPCLNVLNFFQILISFVICICPPVGIVGFACLITIVFLAYLLAFLIQSLNYAPFQEEVVFCFAHVSRLISPSASRSVEFGVSRSKVKVKVTFKLRGAYMCFTNISCYNCVPVRPSYMG